MHYTVDTEQFHLQCGTHWSPHYLHSRFALCARRYPRYISSIEPCAARWDSDFFLMDIMSFSISCCQQNNAMITTQLVCENAGMPVRSACTRTTSLAAAKSGERSEFARIIYDSHSITFFVVLLLRFLSLSLSLSFAARTTLGVCLFLYKSILLDAIIMCRCLTVRQRLVLANARTRVRFHVLIKHKY